MLPGRGHDAARRWALVACTILALVPLWAFDFLPMVDLPQHAAQITIWRHFDDPASGYAERLVVNKWTPYLLVYALALALSFVISVQTALTLVATVAVLGIPLVVARLLRQTGGDPWWVFVCFPIGFGYAFYWGFLNFLLAVPLGLWFLVLAARYADAPSGRPGLVLFGFAHLLFFAHALVYGYVGLAAAAIVLLRAPSLGQAARRCLPLLGSLPLAAGWVLYTQATEGDMQKPTKWFLGGSRLLDLGGLPLGLPPSLDVVAATVLLAATPFLLGARPARRPERWAPFVIALLICLFAPLQVLGTAFVYPRFAIFLFPTLLYALDRGPGIPARTWRRAIAPLLSGAWLLALAFRFWGFNLEVGPFRQAIAAMPPHQRVLYLPVERYSKFVPSPVFLHFGCWYQVERGGMVEFSFSSFFPARFRYLPGSEPPLLEDFEWRPLGFDFEANGGNLYDYFLARAPLERGARLFARVSQPVTLVARAGEWWVYRRGEEDGVSSWTGRPWR